MQVCKRKKMIPRADHCTLCRNRFPVSHLANMWHTKSSIKQLLRKAMFVCVCAIYSFVSQIASCSSLGKCVALKKWSPYFSHHMKVAHTERTYASQGGVGGEALSRSNLSEWVQDRQAPSPASIGSLLLLFLQSVCNCLLFQCVINCLLWAKRPVWQTRSIMSISLPQYKWNKSFIYFQRHQQPVLIHNVHTELLWIPQCGNFRINKGYVDCVDRFLSPNAHILPK